MRAVDRSGVEINESPRRFGERPAGHQRAADIGVLDDADGVTATAEFGRLHAGPCPAERVLGRGFGDADALEADLNAGIVHHGEHGAHARALGADEITDAIVVVAEAHRAGGGGVDAELVLDTDALQIVAGAIGQDLGTQEQADALGAGRRIREPGEDEMDDIVRRIMFTPGDEDLGALDAIAAIGVRRGAGLERADIRAGRRLGEVHRAGPFARDEL